MDQVNTQFIGPHVIFHVESKSVLFSFQKIAPLRCGLWLIFLINPLQDQVINTWKSIIYQLGLDHPILKNFQNSKTDRT